MPELAPPRYQLPLPARRLWIFRHTMVFSLISLAFFLFLVATNTQSGWIYVIVALLCAILLSNYMLAKISVRHIEIKKEFPYNIEKGQTVSITIIVCNTSSSPKFGITVIENLPQSLPDILPQRRFYVGYIPARGEVSFKYELKCLARGYHEFGSTELESCFPWSIFTAHRQLENKNTITVSPELISLPYEIYGDKKSLENIHILMRKAQSDEFYGLRDYRYGDDLRFVHWTASAHAGSLLVRETQEVTSNRNLIIAIDPTIDTPILDPEQKSLESLLSIVATITHLAKCKNFSYNLVSVNNNRIINASSSESEAFLSGIQAELSPQGSQTLLNWITDPHNCPEDKYLIYLSTKSLTKSSGEMEMPILVSPEIHIQVEFKRIPCKNPIYLKFIEQEGERKRFYSSIQSWSLPSDIRKAMQQEISMSEQPLEENFYGNRATLQYGDINQERTLAWIISELSNLSL